MKGTLAVEEFRGLSIHCLALRPASVGVREPSNQPAVGFGVSSHDEFWFEKSAQNLKSKGEKGPQVIRVVV